MTSLMILIAGGPKSKLGGKKSRKIKSNTYSGIPRMANTGRKQCQSKVQFMLMNCPILGLGQILKNPHAIQETQET